MSVLHEILDHYGMPEENIESAVEQIAETYGACRYLDGVNAGAEAVKELGIIKDNKMDNYEDDIHNATNPQLADLLDEIANKAESGSKQMELDNEVLEIIKQEIEIMREAAKRLRIPPHQTFNEEYMGECL